MSTCNCSLLASTNLLAQAHNAIWADLLCGDVHIEQRCWFSNLASCVVLQFDGYNAASSLRAAKGSSPDSGRTRSMTDVQVHSSWEYDQDVLSNTYLLMARNYALPACHHSSCQQGHCLRLILISFLCCWRLAASCLVRCFMQHRRSPMQSCGSCDSSRPVLRRTWSLGPCLQKQCK